MSDPEKERNVAGANPPAPPTKAAEPPKEQKEEKAPEAVDEEKVVEEKLIRVNLRHAYLSYGRKATPKAVRLVKKTASRAFKTAEDEVKLSSSVNETLWRRGKTKTERKVSLRVQKLESGVVRVLMAEA
uniref:Large ribosomal subunit protein eL31 n=1 Tax=Candidatus Methanosuratincola petrocarbonis (ex Vanwonterghem et al. 2016) TaxID=1867261 RepID=A0A7J3V0K9_9CREN